MTTVSTSSPPRALALLTKDSTLLEPPEALKVTELPTRSPPPLAYLRRFPHFTGKRPQLDAKLNLEVVLDISIRPSSEGIDVRRDSTERRQWGRNRGREDALRFRLSGIPLAEWGEHIVGSVSRGHSWVFTGKLLAGSAFHVAVADQRRCFPLYRHELGSPEKPRSQFRICIPPRWAHRFRGLTSELGFRGKSCFLDVIVQVIYTASVLRPTRLGLFRL